MLVTFIYFKIYVYNMDKKELNLIEDIVDIQILSKINGKKTKQNKKPAHWGGFFVVRHNYEIH